MPGVVANAAWAAQGGWGNLVHLGGSGQCFNPSDPGCTATEDYAAMVYQIDTSSAGGKFIDNATRITTYQY